MWDNPAAMGADPGDPPARHRQDGELQSSHSHEATAVRLRLAHELKRFAEDESDGGPPQPTAKLFHSTEPIRYFPLEGRWERITKSGGYQTWLRSRYKVELFTARNENSTRLRRAD